MTEFLMERTRQFLRRFEEDPRAAMAELPEKFDARGEARATPPTAFAAADITDGDYILQRDSVRRRFRTVREGTLVSLDERLMERAAIEDADRAEDLVDTLRHARLADMEEARLRQAALAESPWSDDYWAYYLGCLGRRYADPAFPGSQDWEENHEYVRARPFGDVFRSGDARAIDRLSPSEKYDLLAGSWEGALTRAMWSEGKRYHERDGKVESWMGICHGWAPASYQLPRPRRAVNVLAADGRTTLRFYPSDIKALASLLWANARTVSRFIGVRNHEKRPATDENGRVLSPAAFNTNPGTWHLSVVNQIGVARRSFILDTTYDYEVWNQPVLSYEYSYFSPRTMRPVSSLQGATMPLVELPRDRFRQYRGPAAATITGVVMHVRYVAETAPSHRASDAQAQDQIHTVRYVYDVEQDRSGAIVGGEWYTGKNHPDFLWTPSVGARATTQADPLARGAWNPAEALPESWRRAAWRVDDRGLPLAKIVEQLTRLATG